MRNLIIRLAFLGAVLTLGACADSPTQADRRSAPDLAAPAQDARLAPQGCVLDGLCSLPPIVVDGGCDPWMELDWSCDNGGECMTAAGDPTDPDSTITIQGCPGGGGGGSGGGYTPPPGSEPNPPAEGECEDCNPPEEESTICPQPFLGNTQPALITVAGRNHEFQFRSTVTYPFKRLTGGRSPATYEIGLPTSSKDTWWIAERGTITVWCRGAWLTRTHWLGTMTVLESDLHMVMGPGHPDF